MYSPITCRKRKYNQVKVKSSCLK